MTGHSVLLSSSPGDATSTLFSPAWVSVGSRLNKSWTFFGTFLGKMWPALGRSNLGWILFELFCSVKMVLSLSTTVMMTRAEWHQQCSSQAITVWRVQDHLKWSSNKLCKYRPLDQHFLTVPWPAILATSHPGPTVRWRCWVQVIQCHHHLVLVLVLLLSLVRPRRIIC